MDLQSARGILGVTAASSSEQIREAYLDLVKVWHPDRFPPGSRLKLKAEDKLKEINGAYELVATSATPRSAPSPQTPRAPSSKRASQPSPAPEARSTPPPARPRRPSPVWLVGSLIALWGAASAWDSYLSRSNPPPLSIVRYSPSDTDPLPAEPAQVASPILRSRPLPSTPAPTPAPASWFSQNGIDAMPLPSTPATAAPLSVRCEAEIAPPASGAEIGGRYRGGLGSLTIKNGSESDAIAVVLDATTQQPRRAIYIRRGEVGLMSSMPVGSYIVRFQLGDTWLGSRRFCNISSTSEFEDRIEFTERRSDTGTEFSRVELTLFTVQGGNAPTDALPNVPLLLPEQ